MANKLIVISGKQFSGKDTVGKILLEQLPTFRRIGIGDAIKLEYSRRTGLTREEIEKNKPLYRQDLIDLGDWGRAQSFDYWLKSIIAQDGDILVTDLRLKPELNLFLENGAFTVRVEASEEARAKRGTIVSSNDNTETNLDDVTTWNYVIQNEGTYEELLENVEPLLSEIKKYFGI